MFHEYVLSWYVILLGPASRIVQIDILAKVPSSQDYQRNQLKNKHLEALGLASWTEFRCASCWHSHLIRSAIFWKMPGGLEIVQKSQNTCTTIQWRDVFWGRQSATNSTDTDAPWCFLINRKPFPTFHTFHTFQYPPRPTPPRPTHPVRGGARVGGEVWWGGFWKVWNVWKVGNVFWLIKRPLSHHRDPNAPGHMFVYMCFQPTCSICFQKCRLIKMSKLEFRNVPGNSFCMSKYPDMG